MIGFAQDLRYATRALARNPGFTVLAVFTLALGIGASTAIFSVVHAVLLKQLPYQEAERLVRVRETAPPDIGRDRPVSPVNFVNWSGERELFADIEATTSGQNLSLTLTGTGTAIKLTTDKVSSSFFRTLGIQPILGRAFLPDEEHEGRDQVVILNHDLWQARFGGDRRVVGSVITLDGKSHTIVGVLPPNFRLPDRLSAQNDTFLLLKPLVVGLVTPDRRGEHNLDVVARLRPGVTLKQTELRLTEMAQQVGRNDPEMKGWGVRLVPLLDDVVINIRPTLLALMGAVGCLLLIACANVANMMLVRTTVQAGELAVRAALGAGRFRLVRQLFSQSLILALCGGAGGAILAVWLLDILINIAPLNIPRLNEVTMNASVLTFALAMSAVTSLFFGTVPALRVSRTDISRSLKYIGRTSTNPSGDSMFRGFLVSGEVAIAALLVVEAGLLINTFRHIQSVDLGLKTDHVLTMEIAPPASKYPQPSARVAFFQRVLENAQSVPGVRSAAVVSHFPFGGSAGGGFLIEGRASVNPREWDAEFRSASQDYFRTVGISILEGRSFTSQDAAGAVPVAIINKAMAQRFFPGENPIGKRIRRRTPVENPWLTIVGIVGDVKHSGPTREVYFEVYVPFTQPSWALPEVPFPFPFPRELVVRTETEPMTVAPLLQQQVWAVDKDQPTTAIRTLEGLAGRSVSRQRFTMLLFGAFGLVGLILASVGIYAVLSFNVMQRRHEIGVRSAMGASPHQVMALVVVQGMGFVIAGVILGIAAALALTRLTATLLFEVTPTDPATFVSVSALLLAVALLACYVPARRAARLDPLVALRYE